MIHILDTYRLWEGKQVFFDNEYLILLVNKCPKNMKFPFSLQKCASHSEVPFNVLQLICCFVKYANNTKYKDGNLIY